MKANSAEKSYDLERWLNDVPTSVEEFHKIKDSLTKECRWYLIGKYCVQRARDRKRSITAKKLFTQLGPEFGCSEPTIRRFVSYYKAIENLRLIMPELVIELLSGEIKLAIENTRNLLKRPRQDIPKIVERLRSGDEKVYELFPERIVKPTMQKEKRAGVTVKDTPKYDPDAQVVGLTYTVPSWINAIDRVSTSDNLYNVSTSARKKLIKELSALTGAATAMTELLMK